VKKLLFGFVISTFFIAKAEVMGTPEEEARWRKEAEEELLAQEKAEIEKIRIEAEKKRKAAAELERVMSTLNLDPAQFVVLPQDFAAKVNVKIREKEWRQLQEAQRNKDWLRMLELIPDESGRGHTYTNVPDSNCIQKRVECLKEWPFTLVIEWQDSKFWDNYIYAGYAVYYPARKRNLSVMQVGVDYNEYLIRCDATCKESLKTHVEPDEQRSFWDLTVTMASGAQVERYDRPSGKGITDGRYIVLPWYKKLRLDSELAKRIQSINDQEKNGDLSRVEANNARIEARKMFVDKILGREKDSDVIEAQDQKCSSFPYLLTSCEKDWHDAQMKAYFRPVCIPSGWGGSKGREGREGQSFEIMGDEWRIESIIEHGRKQYTVTVRREKDGATVVAKLSEEATSLE